MKDKTCEVECKMGKSKLSIRYDGKILPCDAFKDIDAAILGDRNKGDTLKQALENMKKNKFLSGLMRDIPKITENNKIIEPCPAQLHYDMKRTLIYICKKCEKCKEGTVTDREFAEIFVKYDNTLFFKILEDKIS